MKAIIAIVAVGAIGAAAWYFGLFGGSEETPASNDEANATEQTAQ